MRILMLAQFYAPVIGGEERIGGIGEGVALTGLPVGEPRGIEWRLIWRWEQRCGAGGRNGRCR